MSERATEPERFEECPPAQPSQHEANKMVRILAGEALKYTVRIHRHDGTLLEFQCMEKPAVKWCDQDRRLWIWSAGYEGYSITRYQEGDVILCEENPGFVPKKK